MCHLNCSIERLPKEDKQPLKFLKPKKRMIAFACSLGYIELKCNTKVNSRVAIPFCATTTGHWGSACPLMDCSKLHPIPISMCSRSVKTGWLLCVRD